MKIKLLLILTAFFSLQNMQAQCPVEPDNPVFLSEAAQVDNTSANFSWTAPAGDSYILVLREGSAVDWTPNDSTDYSNDTANGDFTTAIDQGNGHKVLYTGTITGADVLINGLTTGDTYYFQAFNYCTTSFKYNITEFPTNNGTQNITIDPQYCEPAPTTAQNLITSVDIASYTNSTTSTIGYEDFSGSSNIDLFQSETFTVTVDITADVDSTAHTKVWFDWNLDGVFNDTDESFDLGSVAAGQTQQLTLDVDVPFDNKLEDVIVRFGAESATLSSLEACSNQFGNGEYEDYKINIKNRYTSEILAPTSQVVGVTVDPDTISSIANQFEVFKFDISDVVSDDTLSTKVTQFRLQAGSGNTVDWSTHIADFIFNDGVNDIDGVATINQNEVIFNLTTPLEIQDESIQEITTKIYLISNGNILDGGVLEFEIAAESQFEASIDNSNGFISPLTNGSITSNQFPIDVQATTLRFLTQPTNTNINTSMNPNVRVAAVDNNGNIDIAINPTIEITSTGTMTGDPISVTATDGIAEFSGLVHTDLGTDLTLTADENSLAAVISDPFDIGNSLAEARIISSTLNGEPYQIPSSEIVAAESLTTENAKEVFTFRVQDLGQDNTDTKINQIRFTPSATNTSDWANDIEGVNIVSDGVTYEPTTTAISTNEIILNFDTPLFIDDGSIQDYVAEIFLKSSSTLVEGTIISFEILKDNHGFLSDVSGSSFEASFNADITGNNHLIDIIATEFSIAVQPTDTNINAAMSPAVEVELIDAYGNLDSDNNSIVNLSSTGNLLGNVVPIEAVDGIVTYSNIIHTEAATGLSLSFSKSGFVSVDSDIFEIIQPNPIIETIALQDFDNTTPEWTISNVDLATNNTWGTQYFGTIDSTNIAPLSNANFSGNIFGANNVDAANNTSNVLELAEIDISDYSNVLLSFDYAYLNLQSLDTLKLRVILDDGDSVSTEDFLPNSSNQSESTTFVLPIDDSRSNIKIEFRLFNDASNEYIGIDNIKLEGEKTTIDYVYENDTWTPSDPSGNSTINDNILIMTGSTVWPEFTSTIYANDINIESGAELSVSDELIINGDFLVDGELINNEFSQLYFVGKSIQKFYGQSPLLNVQKLVASSTNGVLISSDINLFQSVTINNGNLTINSGSELTVKSSNSRTAVIGRVAEGSQLLGNVTIERYIPESNRAFRYLSSSITTDGTIKDNFQEGVNNTGTDYPTDNLNPNPGYGTHITGSQGGTDGFDATLTGNPSMFEWTLQNTWTGINNTDNTNLIAGKPYSLMIRGDRSTTLNSNDAIGPATTLRMSGQGENLVYGTTDVQQNALPTVPDSFAFIGNHYQAQVDMKQMVDESTDFQQTVYVYDPTINTRGGYVVVDLTTLNGTATPVESPQNKYLQPNQAFFIKTAQSASPTVNPSIQFKEVYKLNKTQNISVFSEEEDLTKEILLSLYKEIDGNSTLADGIRVQFDQNFSNDVNDEDIRKFWNEGENISTFVDNVNYLTIDRRPEADENTEVQLFSHNFETASYEFKINVSNMENAFLYDAYLDETHQLDLGENIINFDVESSNPSSIASDRFKFVFDNETFSNPVFGDEVDLSIYPNPNAKEDLKIRSTQLNGEEVNINVYDNFGRMIISKKASFENQVMTLDFTQQLNAGLYHLEISNDNFKTNRKLIIE